MTSIIVTNDDGYDAPGILALAQAMRALGDAQVCAPAVNQSASGHKITLFQNIKVSRATVGDGIPALAVGGIAGRLHRPVAFRLGRCQPRYRCLRHQPR